MEPLEWVAVVASLGGLLGATALLAVAFTGICRAPEDGAARFAYGYLGVFGVCLGVGSGLLLIGTAAPHVGSSWLALAAVVAVNLALQPVALLICWTGVRKITLGLRGRLGYAWQEVAEQELADCPVSERRKLARYCVFQGAAALPFGLALSVGCAWPLLQWMTT